MGSQRPAAVIGTLTLSRIRSARRGISRAQGTGHDLGGEGDGFGFLRLLILLLI